MHWDDVQKIYKALGVDINIHQIEHGAWTGYHYTWNPFNEGWYNCRVTEVSETHDEAIAKVVKVASTLLVNKKGMLHSIRENGYQQNGFILK